MKKIIGLLVFTVFAGYTYAQDIHQKNVPAVVLNAFQLKFPNATDVDWELERGNYHVDFEVNNKDNEIVLDDKGKLLKHKQELWESEIPDAVMKTIKSKVAFFDLNDADRKEEGGKIIYDINFEINNKDHDFLLDDKGKLISYVRELRKSEIPASITTVIHNKYGVLDIDDAEIMEKSGKISYQLKGEINDKDHKFLFDDKATLLRHEQDLRNSEIPPAVLNAVKTSYAGYEIRDADLTEIDSKVIYDIEMRKSKDRVHVILNEQGEILEVIKK